MEAQASKIQWIVEDDILLKNAVEEGASLEALAKGAVQFSRRFTLRELQDRWYSLLYDPIISAEASARMVEYEQSGAKFNRAGIAKGNGEVPAKRRAESIRRKYYAMRKKIHGQRLESNSIPSHSFCAPKLSQCNGNQDGDDYRDHMPVTKVSPANSLIIGHIFRLQQTDREDMGPSRVPPGPNLPNTDNEVKNFSSYELLYNDPGNVSAGYLEQKPFDSPASNSGTPLHSMGFSSPTPREPLWRMTEDLSAPIMPINVNLRDECRDVEGTSKFPEGDDCLLNLADENGLLFMDVEASNTMDKSCYDNVNSLLLSSPNHSHEDCVPYNGEPEPKARVLSTCLETSGASSPVMLEIIDDPTHTIHGIQNNFCSDVRVPTSSSVPKPHFPEIHDMIMICSFNTDDLEIPCNDDIFPPAKFAISVTVAGLEKVSDPKSNSEIPKDDEQELGLKEENPECFRDPQMAEDDRCLETRLNHSAVGYGVAPKLTDGTCVDGPSRQAKKVHSETEKCKSVISALASAMKEVQEESDLLATLAQNPPLHEDTDFTRTDVPESILNSSTSDQEEYESDKDVPYFSDIEAVILEMDLCASGHDSLMSAEVSRYQNDDAKKTIIRLEQGACSALQRHMASRGAFAIFYGRRLKHYITKTEVILGRATDEMDVDIDFGKEGPANKISRRQACIKMDRDGNFFLKNLGKVPMAVNGREIATGQLLTLSSSCLIQIREMSFIFEFSDKAVRQYLANMVKDIKQEKSTFDWVPAGLP